ncbi:MAG: histidine triad nucleotide-binding protein [Gammaproteobacteria bacterium]
MTDCIFCKLSNNDIPTEKLYEDDKLYVIKDIRPKAPTHLLAITHEHISSLKEANASHAALLGHVMVSLQRFAKQAGLSDFRVIANSGPGAGQEVFHLHFHILGGPGHLPGF